MPWPGRTGKPDATSQSRDGQSRRPSPHVRGAIALGRMITTRILAAALLAAPALTACDKPEEALKAEAPPSITAHVRVLDADVLVIDGQHLRLANAYGPESLLHARCWAESLAADHAAEK